MNKKRLQRLLSPKTIALYGGAWAHIIEKQNHHLGFTGTIYTIHPTKEGCYRSLDDIDDTIDAAFLGVNSTITVNEIKKLDAANVGGAVCFAAGFKEHEYGQDLSTQLIKNAGDMPFIGANCYGCLNYFDTVSLFPDYVPKNNHIGADGRGVALITQSGTLAITLINQRRFLPIGYVITLGNQEGLTLEQAVDYVLDDARVSAIGLYIEHIQNIEEFSRVACRANQCTIPIIALKAGRSQLAQQTALTHTGSLSGADTLYDILFKNLGIARVDNLSLFTELLKLVHQYGALHDNSMMIMAASGGDISVAADVAHGYDINFPQFVDEDIAPLHDYGCGPINVANPLDFSTYSWHKPDSMYKLFYYVCRHKCSIYALILDPPDIAANGDKDESFTIAITAFAEAIKQARYDYDHPINAVLVSSMADNVPPDIRSLLQHYNIITLGGLPEFFDSAALANRIKRPMIQPFIPHHIVSYNRYIATEYQAKQYLQAYDINVPKHFLYDATMVETHFAACQHNVVLKICDPDIMHKSDIGGVRLNLDTLDKVRQAYDNIHHLGANVLMEEMLDTPLLELMIGIEYDNDFGHYMVLNIGGIYTELYREAMTLLLPTTINDIQHALEECWFAPILKGYRGKKGTNMHHVAATLHAIGQVVTQHDDIISLEINPLMVYQHDAVCTAIISDVILVTSKPLIVNSLNVD